MRICPACKTEIANDNAKFCKKCGAKLPPLKCQINEKNEDVTKLTNDDIMLSEKVEKPVNNTDGDRKKDEKLDSDFKNEDVKEKIFEQKDQAPLGDSNNTTTSSVYTYTSEWLKSNTQIKGWLTFFLLAIFVGGLVSAVSSFTNFDVADYRGNIWLGAVDIFIGVSLFAIAIYTIYAFIQRKPNALFYGRLYVFLVFVTNIISAIGGNIEFGTAKEVIRGVIWSIIWFFYLLLSNQVQKIIPKSFRKVKTADWSILAVFIVIPILCFAIGMAKLNSKGYSTESITPLENPLTDTVVVDNEMEGEDRIEEKTPEEKNLSFLKKAITEANDSYPMKVEDGVVAKKCFLDGEYVMYDYECDEDVINMDILSQNKYNVKRVIMKNLKNADVETLMFKRMCVKANKGIGYKYIGKTSGKAVIIKFSCQELKNYSKISGIDKKMNSKHVRSEER